MHEAHERFSAVLAVVAGLVVAKLVTGSNTGPSTATGTGTAGDHLLSTLSSAPAGTLDKVGAGSVQGSLQKISAPALNAGGKPKVLYIGAEYCPYCAAERWPITVALSRFGKFTGLGTTHSASNDVFPNTPTLSFHGASFTSKYVAFTGVETSSNKLVNGQYAPLDTPSPADQKTFATYDRPPYVSGGAGAIPFIDIAGRYVSAGATYSPQLLAGKTHQQIAAALKDPTSPIAQAVDGSANLFTAAICKVTGNKPGNVCTAKGVKAAAAHLTGS
ncbi:MAG: DUF929 family protein [Nocardioidaceae bacterium]